MISHEEYEKLPDEEKRLVDLERKAIKSMKEIHYEFYKNIGRIDSLKFTKLVETHCWEMLQLLYETREHSVKRYRTEGIDKKVYEN